MVAEVALALVLLIGAGLLIRSLIDLWNVNPGFDSHNLLTFSLASTPSVQSESPDAVRARLRETVSKLQSIPGVEAVSLERGSLPLSTDSEDPVYIMGRPKPAAQKDMPWALWYEVQPDYLKVMHIPLLNGRFFTSADDEHSARVAVIDESFANQLFPGQNPLGQTVVDPDFGPALVVGVVGHVRQFTLSDNAPVQSELYFPFAQIPEKYVTRVAENNSVLLRSQVAPLSLLPAIQSSMASFGGGSVVYGTHAMDDIISDSLSAQRFAMELLAAFSLMALILASIGLYGVISYLVGQRTHEIGIRMALGARQSDVLRLVVADGARMSLLGIAIGIVVSLFLTRFLHSQLYGVSATDPVTFISVSALLLAVAAAASYIPARRASRVDPLVALRHD